MKHIDIKLVLIGCKFKNAYKRFLLERSDRVRNKLFNLVLPTIEKQIAYAFYYLRITNNEMQKELLQVSIIKVLDKVTIERIKKITNLNGYIRTLVINTIRDYYTLLNIYNKHIREYKGLLRKGLQTQGRIYIQESEETPQSELIIKPIVK